MTDTGGTVRAVAGAIQAIAVAADRPDAVLVSVEERRRAKDIGRTARKALAALARIDGPIDTTRERLLLARAKGMAAELRALGVVVEHPLLAPT